jgi:hypothetical protein
VLGWEEHNAANTGLKQGAGACNNQCVQAYMLVLLLILVLLPISSAQSPARKSQHCWSNSARERHCLLAHCCCP